MNDVTQTETFTKVQNLCKKVIDSEWGQNALLELTCALRALRGKDDYIAMCELVMNTMLDAKIPPGVVPNIVSEFDVGSSVGGSRIKTMVLDSIRDHSDMLSHQARDSGFNTLQLLWVVDNLYRNHREYLNGVLKKEAPTDDDYQDYLFNEFINGALCFSIKPILTYQVIEAAITWPYATECPDTREWIARRLRALRPFYLPAHELHTLPSAISECWSELPHWRRCALYVDFPNVMFDMAVTPSTAEGVSTMRPFWSDSQPPLNGDQLNTITAAARALFPFSVIGAVAMLINNKGNAEVTAAIKRAADELREVVKSLSKGDYLPDDIQTVVDSINEFDAAVSAHNL